MTPIPAPINSAGTGQLRQPKDSTQSSGRSGHANSFDAFIDRASAPVPGQHRTIFGPPAPNDSCGAKFDQTNSHNDAAGSKRPQSTKFGARSLRGHSVTVRQSEPPSRRVTSKAENGKAENADSKRSETGNSDDVDDCSNSVGCRSVGTSDTAETTLLANLPANVSNEQPANIPQNNPGLAPIGKAVTSVGEEQTQKSQPGKGEAAADSSSVLDEEKELPVAPEAQIESTADKHSPSIKKDQAASAITAAQDEPLGISSAKQEEQMKKTEKMVKNAEPSLQDLPREASLADAAEQAVPSAQSSVNSSMIFSEKFIAAPPALAGQAISTTAAAPAITPPLSTQTPMLAVERTHELISMHAIRLGESDSDSLRVIIEPGDGLHLSLELRWCNDGIEAQARLHRGDYEFLRAHWAELQQRLEPRGIHLASLQGAEQSVGQQFSNSDQQFANQRSTDSEFAEFAFGGSTTEPPASRIDDDITHTGFESWA